MIQRLSIFLFFTLSLCISKAEIENNVVLFNDSTVNQMKLMSFSMSNQKEMEPIHFTSPKLTPLSRDFSAVHSMRFYVKCTDTLSFYLTFTSSGISSNKVLIKISPNQGYLEVSIPFITSTNELFNAQAIDGLKIEWNNAPTSSYLIDEIAFNYFEPEIISKKPSNKELKQRLDEEEDSYKRRKKREGSSDFFKKRKEYESR